MWKEKRIVGGERMDLRLFGHRGKGQLFWDVGESEFAVGLSDFKVTSKSLCVCGCGVCGCASTRVSG